MKVIFKTYEFIKLSELCTQISTDNNVCSVKTPNVISKSMIKGLVLVFILFYNTIRIIIFIVPNEVFKVCDLSRLSFKIKNRTYSRCLYAHV